MRLLPEREFCTILRRTPFEIYLKLNMFRFPPTRACVRIPLMDHPASITQLLVRWSEGNQAALEQLAPRVYRELHALAGAYLRRSRPNQTLQPTALINEAWVRLIGQAKPIAWENRAHFFGIAARLMRLALVDQMRSRGAAKRSLGFRSDLRQDRAAGLKRSSAAKIR
jgi:RNA polymerase sigma factor (TIGR02999 family)